MYCPLYTHWRSESNSARWKQCNVAYKRYSRGLQNRLWYSLFLGILEPRKIDEPAARSLQKGVSNGEKDFVITTRPQPSPSGTWAPEVSRIASTTATRRRTERRGCGRGDERSPSAATVERSSEPLITIVRHSRRIIDHDNLNELKTHGETRLVIIPDHSRKVINSWVLILFISVM